MGFLRAALETAVAGAMARPHVNGKLLYMTGRQGNEPSSLERKGVKRKRGKRSSLRKLLPII